MYAIYYNNKGKLTGPWKKMVYTRKDDANDDSLLVKNFGKKKTFVYPVKVTPIIK